MRNKIVFGRYIHTGSWIHELDPRAKTLAMLLFMSAVFLIDSYGGVLAVLAFALIVMRSSKIPLTYFVRAIKPLTFILLFTVIFHLMFESSGSRYIDLGMFTVYSGGIEKGLISASRMMLFIAFAALLTFTTKPERLVQGLGSLLKPLRYVGGRPDKLSLMIGTALRFIPVVFEEAQRIWKAQVSRGLDLREQPLRRRASLVLALLVPVTAGAFRRAVDLADSMEARGYRLGAPRTAYRALSWRLQDTLFLCFFLPAIAAAFIL